jgi:8-oxo-dGTP pyrophosphatase MutT (NUDIX family)
MAAQAAATDYELLVTPEELKGGGVEVDYNYEAYARKTLAGDADDIERAWTKKLETHPKTYDGFKFRLHAVAKNDGKVTLQVGLTAYREYVGTQTNPRLRAAGNAYLSNALGCECVLTTADKKIVLLRRSTDVAYASGLYNGPSGHAEPQYVWNKNIAREVLRDGIVREIVEEVGIPEKALSEPRLIGVMRDVDSKPDCLFVVETTQTSDEVKEGYRHALEAWESERLAFVDSEDCGLALTPVTRAAFACLARDRAL